MKWVTFISCLCLLSCTESKNLYRTYRDAEHDTIKRALVLGEELGDVCTIVYSQMLQKADLAEVDHLVQETLALAKKCAADEDSDPECKIQIDSLMLNKICHEEAMVNKHGLAHCCAQTDPERHECFLTHKAESKDPIPPYQKPDPEEACKKFHDDEHAVEKEYYHRVGAKYHNTKVVTIYQGGVEYKKVMTACCQAEDKPACFKEKATAAKKKFLKEVAIEQHQCAILKKYDVKVIKGMKIVQLAQKFPKAPMEKNEVMADKIVHIYQEGCKGDTLDAMLDREALSQHVCSHQAELSSKLGACCEKPILERGECIAHAENDDKPEDLPETLNEFFDNEAVCQHYTDGKDAHTKRFLYNLARKHDDYAEVLCLRLAKDYQDLLEKCCPTDHKVACLQEGREQLKKYVDDTKALVKANCDQFNQIGNYFFANSVIMRNAKKAPQLPTAELLLFAKKVADAAAKCCAMDENHRFFCAVQRRDLLLGSICKIHEEHPINKQVCKCCSGPYTLRGDCYNGLGVDPEYVPGPFKPELLTFHGDFCDAPAEVKEEKKQTVLAEVVHAKPAITDEQLAERIVDFGSVVEKCCGAEDKDACFDAETPELIKRSEAALGEH